MICRIEQNKWCNKLSNVNDNDQKHMIVIIVKLERHSDNIMTTTYCQISKFWPRKHNPKMDFNYTNPSHNNNKQSKK